MYPWTKDNDAAVIILNNTLGDGSAGTTSGRTVLVDSIIREC